MKYIPCNCGSVHSYDCDHASVVDLRRAIAATIRVLHNIQTNDETPLNIAWKARDLRLALECPSADKLERMA